MAATETLDQIGLRHGTDKSSAHHDFLRHYERILSSRRPVTRMIEIGVFDGGSLRMWGDYFPDAYVVGVDLDPRCKAFETERLKIDLADQSNVNDLNRLIKAHGPFDLVVDDGSHLWSHQILTFETLFPAVLPGGTYILEDIDTSFGHFVGDYGKDSTISAAQYVTRLATYVLAGGAKPLSDLDDLRSRTFIPMIDNIEWIRRSAIITRSNVPST